MSKELPKKKPTHTNLLRAYQALTMEIDEHFRHNDTLTSEEWERLGNEAFAHIQFMKKGEN